MCLDNKAFLSTYAMLIIHYSVNNILMTLLLSLVQASVTEENSRNVSGVSNVSPVTPAGCAEGSVSAGDVSFTGAIP